jgi:hypothetical protein
MWNSINNDAIQDFDENDSKCGQEVCFKYFELLTVILFLVYRTVKTKTNTTTGRLEPD